MVSITENKDETNCIKSLCIRCHNCLSRISSTFVNGLETGFNAYGSIVGRNPWTFVLLCLVITGVCSIGLIRYDADQSEAQFMSDDSLFKRAVDWKEENFAFETHIQQVIFESENVLDKDVLLEMLRVRNEILNMTVGDITWDDICAKRPFHTPCNVNLSPEFVNYCERQESLGRICREESILEIWNYDEEVIRAASQEQIFEDVNRNLARVSSFLGGQNDKNATDGDLTEAKVVTHAWFTDATEKQVKNSVKWEESFIKKIEKISSESAGNVSFSFVSTSSFGKIISDDINSDLRYLFAGFILVFIYVTVMLGKFNLVEQRPILSLNGLSCIGLSIAVSYGLSSAFHIPFGAMNSILPFLLLGLGIDDMFVIITAWNNIPRIHQDKSISERIGMTMQHAGVSITVTSVTNFLAFLIGSSSDLPALRYFCLYAAIGIAAIYFFQATFFVACLAIDQKRVEANRQGCFWCWKIENWHPNQCSQIDLCKIFFTEIYGKYLFKTPAQIFILLFTALLFCVSCWGASNIQQEFDPMWFLPPDSYLSKFIEKRNVYYPTSGESAMIYFSNISHLEIAKTEELVTAMRESQYINKVQSWYEKFLDYYYEVNGNVSLTNVTKDEFFENLTNFLYSCEGSRFRGYFRFNRPINCTGDLPDIISSSISYDHTKIQTTTEKMKAIKDIFSIVNELEFDGFVVPYTQIYVTWETNYVIGKELLQNILLALLMVFLVTLFLLASLPVSFLVMLCVLATLVDVTALMHWWGLTIDTISAIDLVLAIGLSVDYAAHVAHTYLTVAGEAKERAKVTVGQIGPAVLNGGFTTFLSFFVLVGSDSYVFRTFFKIFFAVCLYGVYHGLVFLPVLLSLTGPAPYSTAQQVTKPSTPGQQKPPTPIARNSSSVEPLPPLQNQSSETIKPVILNSLTQDNGNLFTHRNIAQTPSSLTNRRESHPSPREQSGLPSSLRGQFGSASSKTDHTDSISTKTDQLSSSAYQISRPQSNHNDYTFVLIDQNGCHSSATNHPKVIASSTASLSSAGQNHDPNSSVNNQRQQSPAQIDLPRYSRASIDRH